MVLPQDSSTQRKYLGKPRHILSAFRWASLVAHLVKNPPAMQGSNMGLIPGMGRALGERKGYPLQYSGLENSIDSPWFCKESDMTERLSHFTFTSFSPLPFTSLLFSDICKASSDNHFAFFHFFFLEMVLSLDCKRVDSAEPKP